jgi:predicted PolB exonuclease-like 3'-5' exonuclease
MPSAKVRYLVFDIESIADGELISKVKYAGENYSAGEAVDTYCGELLERFGSEFIPSTYHLPVAIAIIKVDEELRIIDIVTLDAPEYRPHVIAKTFWDGWKAYKMPTLVSFNGRSYDIPVMELAAFRFGISIPDWFNMNEKSWDQRRNRYNHAAHLDLQDVLTNYGATRYFTGGLNLAANLLGKPGKMGIAGHMVQDLYNQGEIARINDYCRCDVLDTYFVLLRTKVLTGDISLEQEQGLVAEAHQWLEDHAEEHPIYAEYLAECRPWENPWLARVEQGET